MKMRDSFIVKLGVELGWTALCIDLGIPWASKGPWASFVTAILDFIIGYIADKGILLVDLGEDAFKIAMQRKEYRDAALKAYNKAQARVYTEAEKEAIREEFKKIIEQYGPVPGVHPKSTPSSVSDSQDS